MAVEILVPKAHTEPWNPPMVLPEKYEYATHDLGLTVAFGRVVWRLFRGGRVVDRGINWNNQTTEGKDYLLGLGLGNSGTQVTTWNVRVSPDAHVPALTDSEDTASIFTTTNLSPAFFAWTPGTLATTGNTRYYPSAEGTITASGGSSDAIEWMALCQTSASTTGIMYAMARIEAATTFTLASGDSLGITYQPGLTQAVAT